MFKVRAAQRKMSLFSILFIIFFMSIIPYTFVKNAYGATPVEIYTVEDLDAIRNDLTEEYILMNNIDFESCSSYADCSNRENFITGSGWVPIGNMDIIAEPVGFTGTFNGQGYIISNLYIDKDSSGEELPLAGLFGLSYGVIKNVGLDDVDITLTLSDDSSGLVGALVGVNAGDILNCFSKGEITLTGGHDGTTGPLGAGGLVGGHTSNTEDDVPLFSNAYSNVSVNSSLFAGGLVGYHINSLGEDVPLVISNSYSTGSVVGAGAGGLIGSKSDATIENSFWDVDSSDVLVSDGGTGKSSSEMKSIPTFSDTSTVGLDTVWDILEINTFDVSTPSTWYIDSGEDYPRLYFEYPSDVDVPKVVITDIGLMDDILDRDSLLYYFTSTTAVIKGNAYPNSTVLFDLGDDEYTAEVDDNGGFEIDLGLVLGTNSIEYYAYDDLGNESPKRDLTLVVGSSYFPDWLLGDLGLLEEETEENKEVDDDGHIEVVVEEEVDNGFNEVGLVSEPIESVEIDEGGVKWINILLYSLGGVVLVVVLSILIKRK